MNIKKYFSDIDFGDQRAYYTDYEPTPFEFYIKTIPYCKEIKMHLGYFSTYAVSFLSSPLAHFIYNGGILKIITNSGLNESDIKNLIEGKKIESIDDVDHIFKNVKLLASTLNDRNKHFFDCLRYLQKNNRLFIKPVLKKNNGNPHHKTMIFYDGKEKIGTNGSMNFTLNGITVNGESFTLILPENDTNKKTINKQESIFDKIFNGKDPLYEHLDGEQIRKLIEINGQNKNVEELLDDSIRLERLNHLDKTSKTLLEEHKKILIDLYNDSKKNKKPTFRFENPYPYQVDAYENWVKNDYIGLFEMATGTGKTLTSILCLINYFNSFKIQKNIIVVPGEELVEQWFEELKISDFKYIFKWYSKNNSLNNDIKKIKNLKHSDELNIIITYKSFQSEKFKLSLGKDLSEYIVIFDEAHNMGSSGFMENSKTFKFRRRIGLSATPLKDWDEKGSNDFIYNFFNISEPTFVFPLKQAIGKFLCNYNYNPRFAFLNNEEWNEYKDWTRKIFKSNEEGKLNSTALFMRQQVVDKCEDKLNILLKIVDELKTTNDLNHTLIYCPKGEDDENDEERIIYKIGKLISDKYSQKINGQFFLGETKYRKNLIEDFSKGMVQFIYAIKCLDEGVNIPITKNAIFIASGKNKREYIQRRGRVLRKHGDKVSNIFDIVTLPPITIYENEKESATLFILNEFERIIEFLETSISKDVAIKLINEKLLSYNLNFNEIKELIKNRYEERNIA